MILVVAPLVDVAIVAPEALVLRVTRGVEFGHARKVLDGIEQSWLTVIVTRRHLGALLEPVNLLQECLEAADQFGIPGAEILVTVLGTIETIECAAQDRPQPLQVGDGLRVDDAEEDAEHLAELHEVHPITEVGEVFPELFAEPLFKVSFIVFRIDHLPRLFAHHVVEKLREITPLEVGRHQFGVCVHHVYHQVSHRFVAFLVGRVSIAIEHGVA